jgi:hypothetical protein
MSLGSYKVLPRLGKVTYNASMLERVHLFSFQSFCNWIFFFFCQTLGTPWSWTVKTYLYNLGYSSCNINSLTLAFKTSFTYLRWGMIFLLLAYIWIFLYLEWYYIVNWKHHNKDSRRENSFMYIFCINFFMLLSKGHESLFSTVFHSGCSHPCIQDILVCAKNWKATVLTQGMNKSLIIWVCYQLHIYI